MYRVIKAGKQSPRTKYVYEFCDKAGWNRPGHISLNSNGYKLKWGGRSYVDHIVYDLKDQAIRDEYGLDDNERGSHYMANTYGVGWGSIANEIYEKHDVYNRAWEQAREELKEVERDTGVKLALTREGNIVLPYPDGITL